MDGGGYIETSSELPVLRQGTVVEYKIPQAIEPEPSFDGPQRGIIISSNEFNGNGAQALCVCPYFEEASPLGIRILLQSGKEVFARPDLAGFVDKDRLQTIPSLSTDGPLIWKPYNVQRIIYEFMNLIKYEPKKTYEPAPRGLLRFGEIGWFHSMPHLNSEECCWAPAVCLTTPSEYRRTGLIRVTRGFSHIERGNPRVDVAITGGPFAGGFLSTTALMLVQAGRISRNPKMSRAMLNEMALKGIEKKLYGTLDNNFYRRDITIRYSNVRNDWTPKVKAALRSRPSRGHNFETLTR
jgi:hypothetical protein